MSECQCRQSNGTMDITKEESDQAGKIDKVVVEEEEEEKGPSGTICMGSGTHPICIGGIVTLGGST